MYNRLPAMVDYTVSRLLILARLYAWGSAFHRGSPRPDPAVHVESVGVYGSDAIGVFHTGFSTRVRPVPVIFSDSLEGVGVDEREGSDEPVSF